MLNNYVDIEVSEVMDDLPNIEARISRGQSKTATFITSIRARTSWTAPLSAEACTWGAT